MSHIKKWYQSKEGPLFYCGPWNKDGTEYAFFNTRTGVIIYVQKDPDGYKQAMNGYYWHDIITNDTSFSTASAALPQHLIDENHLIVYELVAEEDAMRSRALEAYNVALNSWKAGLLFFGIVKIAFIIGLGFLIFKCTQ